MRRKTLIIITKKRRIAISLPSGDLIIIITKKRRIAISLPSGDLKRNLTKTIRSSVGNGRP